MIYLRIIFLIISIAAMVLRVSAQSSSILYNPDMPVLTQDVYINPNTINDQLNYHNGIDLTDDYGHVYIPPTKYKHDGRSRGLLIARCCDGHYSVMEARCPRCFYKFHNPNNRIEFEHVLVGECKHCHATSEVFTFWGSGQLNRKDKDKINEIYHMDSYCVDEIQLNGKTYLRIYNNPLFVNKPKNQLEEPSVPFYYPGTEPPEYRPHKICTLMLRD